MNREHRRRRWLVAALAALFWGSLGISCQDVVGPPEGSRPPASLRVVADQGVFPHLGGFAAFVDVIVTTDRPFQAVNLKVSWDSDAVSWAEAFPHPEFDDDGKLFGARKLGAHSLSNIVDLRHGGGAPSGSVRVARVTFVSDAPDPVEIRVLGEIAAPDGTLFSIVLSEFATVVP
jgi:hypothetical protein